LFGTFAKLPHETAQLGNGCVAGPPEKPLGRFDREPGNSLFDVFQCHDNGAPGPVIDPTPFDRRPGERLQSQHQFPEDLGRMHDVRQPLVEPGLIASSRERFERRLAPGLAQATARLPPCAEGSVRFRLRHEGDFDDQISRPDIGAGERKNSGNAHDSPLLSQS